MKKINLVGHRYGRLTVVSEDPKRISNKICWRCLCDCENTAIVIGNDLRTGKTRSCGCLDQETINSKKKDLSGKKFGRLTVIDQAKIDKKGRWWNCLCLCSKKCIIKGLALKTGNTKSCGCLATESKKSKTGENNHNWRFDLSQEERENRRQCKEYTEWRTNVFSRDNYTCQICEKSSGLNAHHLDGWNWCIERRHDIDNGVTLCVDCHERFHAVYGKGDNSLEQFEEFLEMERSEV
tara:strand:+ start:4330 stop:5040 length:711 start_codon:yes stop_codon:yes gene_type:complete